MTGIPKKLILYIISLTPTAIPKIQDSPLSFSKNLNIVNTQHFFLFSEL